MERKTKLRSLLLGVFFTLLFTGLVVRIYWVQVVDAASLRTKAEVNWDKPEVLAAKRGEIVDRNGRTLAQEAAAYTVSVNPQFIHDKIIKTKDPAYAKLDADISRGLAAILSPSQDPTAIADLEKRILALVNKKKADDSGYLVNVEIKPEGWKIDGETKKKVDAFIDDLAAKLNTKSKSFGIYMQETEKRYYPSDRLASHIIGYTDKEGKPIGGIEAQFDELLRGKDGKLNHERDARGVELPNSKMTIDPAVDGKTVRLTIDQNIQYYVETALKQSYDKWKPKSMTAIAVDPQTMEVLAMANAPDFNPNKYWDFKSQSDFINHAISSQYEPGSTFKLVTLAGAIQEGLFNPNDKYQSGQVQVPGRTLHDHEVNGWGKITYMEGLLRSSNVAFVNLGYFKLGETKLSSYIKNFGFGQKTGISLPNEVSGKISMNYPADYATATYGQGGVAVTLLQQVAAYAAVANGGKLLQPQIVKDIVDSQTGEVVQTFEPKVIRQVITPETAQQTTLDLEQVVANQEIGTGKRAYINGYRVAGKTGTANIVTEGGKYSDDTWVITFIGFAPVENPRLLVAVLADQPDLGGNYHRGGEVAAPVFKDIITQTLHYMNVRGTTDSTTTATNVESIATVPDLSGQTLADAKKTLTQSGLKADVLGSGGKVIKQSPEPGTEVSMSQRVLLVTQEASEMQVPSMIGKSLREVLELCGQLQVQCKANGEGYVTGQSMSDEAGGKTVVLELKPLNEDVGKSDGAAASASPTQSGSKKQDAAKGGGSASSPTPKPTPSPPKKESN